MFIWNFKLKDRAQKDKLQKGIEEKKWKSGGEMLRAMAEEKKLIPPKKYT